MEIRYIERENVYVRISDNDGYILGPNTDTSEIYTATPSSTIMFEDKGPSVSIELYIQELEKAVYAARLDLLVYKGICEDNNLI